MIKWLSKKNQRFLSLTKKTLGVFILVKFPEAEIRKFRNVFVCRKCKTKIKSPNIKIIQGKVSCRRCGGKAFKAVRKK